MNKILYAPMNTRFYAVEGMASVEAFVQKESISPEKSVLAHDRDEFFFFDPSRQRLVHASDKSVWGYLYGARLFLSQADPVSQAILDTLVRDPDPRVRRGVSFNKNASAEHIFILSSDDDKGVLQRVAGSKKASAEALRKVHSTGVAKEEIASNENTPGDILTELAGSDDDHIRGLVASNESTPPAVLGALAKDDEPRVKRAVAANKKTPVETLVWIWKDWGDASRSVIESVRFPDVLDWIARNDEPRLRLIAAESQKVRSSTLSFLASDPEVSVRFAVAKHKKTPDEVLVRLQNDPDEDVRWEAER